MNLKFITKSLNRHLRPNNLFFLFVLAAVLQSCGEEPSRKDYAARVNNSYLTDEEIAEIIDTNSGNFYRNEVIRNWIDRELLYQQAVEEGIIEEEKFKMLIENSKKELAASMLLEQLKREENISVSEEEIEQFYEEKINEFRLSDNHFYFNIIEFKEEEKAVQFRSIALDSDWNRGLNVFKGDKSVLREKTSQFLSEFEIYPVELLRMIKELQAGEISIVLNTDQNRFIVVQLLHEYWEGTIPALDIIKDRIRKKIYAIKRENLIREYIHELYSNNEIEVKNLGDK